MGKERDLKVLIRLAHRFDDDVQMTIGADNTESALLELKILAKNYVENIKRVFDIDLDPYVVYDTALKSCIVECKPKTDIDKAMWDDLWGRVG